MAPDITTLPRYLSYLPWQKSMTLQPIEQVLAAPLPAQRDLCNTWQRAKLDELSFVGLTSAVVSGVFASAFSWSNIDAAAPWTLWASWYSGLLLALISICIAMQQSVALYRLSCSEDGYARILSLFSYKQSGVLKPRLLQIYNWQVPVMLLNISIVLFLLGLVILVFHEAFYSSKDWKMVFVFSVAASFGCGNYIFSTITLYSGLDALKN